MNGRRLIVLLLGAAFLAGCGGGGSGGGETSTGAQTSKPVEGFKMAIATDIGSLQDRSFNRLANEGRRSIGKKVLNYKALNAVAPRFQKLQCAGIDQDYALFSKKPKNATGVIFAEQEAGYLVGYLAGLEAKKEGFDTISAVGANNVPAIVRYISG